LDGHELLERVFGPKAAQSRPGAAVTLRRRPRLRQASRPKLLKIAHDRPLDAGPCTFVRVDALVIEVREDGRTINVHALVAVAVNANGGRAVLGLEISSDEDRAGWRSCAH
jgi:transposase-like protein